MKLANSLKSYFNNFYCFPLGKKRKKKKKQKKEVLVPLVCLSECPDNQAPLIIFSVTLLSLHLCHLSLSPSPPPSVLQCPTNRHPLIR